MKDELLKLAGMEYFTHYSPEYWKDKTGVDPRDFPEYFEITSNRIRVTEKFKKEYKLHMASVKANFSSLGVVL